MSVRHRRPHPKHKLHTRDEVRAAHRLYRDGLSLKAVGRRMRPRITAPTVARRFRDHGLRVRSKSEWWGIARRKAARP